MIVKKSMCSNDFYVASKTSHVSAGASTVNEYAFYFCICARFIFLLLDEYFFLHQGINNIKFTRSKTSAKLTSKKLEVF